MISTIQVQNTTRMPVVSCLLSAMAHTLDPPLGGGNGLDADRDDAARTATSRRPSAARRCCRYSDLSAMGEPGCDLAGTSLTFADDTLPFAVGPPTMDGDTPTLVTPAVGAVFSQGDGEGRELLIVNWGVPGVGVAAIEDGHVVQVWASSADAMRLHRQQLAIENVDFD